jgi:4-alpha-glucanotransferase
VQNLKDFFEQWEKDRLYYEDCTQVLKLNQCEDEEMPYERPRAVALYSVYLGFDQILEEKKRTYFQNMATSFNLQKQEVDDLRKVSSEILDQSEAFNALLDDLSIKPSNK